MIFNIQKCFKKQITSYNLITNAIKTLITNFCITFKDKKKLIRIYRLQLNILIY